MERAVHRLEHVAIDLAGAHAIGQFRTAAVAGCEFFHLLVIDHRRVLALAVIGEVARRAEEVEPADVWRKHRGIALATQVFADELLQFIANDRALGFPEDQALPDDFVDGEEPELGADDTVIALLGFFLLRQVGVEISLREKCCAVDALEAIALDIAMPVGRCDGRDFEGSDRARVWHVRPHAEVFPVRVFLPGDVPRQFCGASVDRALGVIELVLVALSRESRHTLSRVEFVPGERPILLNDLLHLRFDLRKIVGRNRRLHRDVVVEPRFQRRAISELHFVFSEHALDRFRHHVRGGVSKEVERIRVVLALGSPIFFRARLGEDRQVAVTRQRAIQVPQLPVDLRADGSTRQPRADVRSDLCCRNSLRKFLDGPVGQSDLHG